MIQGRGLGSGKSYFVASEIYRRLISGHTVVVTESFKFLFDKAKELAANWHNVVLEASQFIVIPEAETLNIHKLTPAGTADSPVLVIIDEAHDHLNARDWADKSRRPFFSWLTQSRHDDTDVWFISQNLNNVDKQCARLVTRIFQMRDMKETWIAGIGQWRTKSFRCDQMDGDGRRLERSWYIRKDKRIFGIYVSKNKAGAHGRAGVIEGRKQLASAGNWVFLRSRMFKFFIVLVIVCGCAAGYWAYKGKDKFDGFAIKKERKGAAVAEAASVKTVPAQVSPAPTVAVPPPVRTGPVLEKELFRAGDGVSYMRTEQRTYWLGEFGPFGVVVKITPRAVVCMGPGNVQTVVIGEERASTSAPVPASATAPPPSPAAIAAKTATVQSVQRAQVASTGEAQLPRLPARPGDGPAAPELDANPFRKVGGEAEKGFEHERARRRLVFRHRIGLPGSGTANN